MCGLCGCSHRDGESHHQGHAHGHPRSLVVIEREILAENNRHARVNRQRLQHAGVFSLNLVSSPGSGKTTLLIKTIAGLKAKKALAVIEGDQETSIDAELIRATGVPSIQINTGRVCHLDAHMVAHALEDLALEPDSLLFIENVGNLVCPAGFDLGETHKVAILSVAEGDSKPLKYPDMFAAASALVLSKIDLLPHVDFDVDRCIEYARSINPEITVLQVSAKTGDGMDRWIDWLTHSAKCEARAVGETVRHA